MNNFEQAAALHHELLANGVEIFDTRNQHCMQQVFAGLSGDQLTYGTSVTYLLQQIHGYHFPNVTDLRGYCFTQDNGKTICPIAIAPRPLDGALAVVVISPRGARVAETVKALKNIVQEIDDTCVFYVKNPPPQLATALDGQTAVTPWNERAPFEDDTYPNVIVNVAELASEISFSEAGLYTKQGQPYVNVKKKLRGLERKLASNTELKCSIADFALMPYLPGDHWPIAQGIIERFFAEKDKRGHLSKPVDYYNIFTTPVDWRASEHCIRALLMFRDGPLGLVAAERIGGKDSGLFGTYSSLIVKPPAALPEKLSISELQNVLLLHDIHARGGQFADFGGAETEELQHNHVKFLAEHARGNAMQPVASSPWLQLAL